MKIRNGFVSNSSSSSFMVGIARINDLDKFKKYLNSVGINPDEIKDYEFNIGTLKDFEHDIKPRYNGDGSDIVIESFRDYARIKIEPGDEWFVSFNYVANEGDTGIFSNDDGYGCNYDIDYDYFEEYDYYKIPVAIVAAMNRPDSGLDITGSDYSYGADRNG